ncbi:MAG: hypothetical protein WCH59_01110 [Chitinophagia bacterium]
MFKQLVSSVLNNFYKIARTSFLLLLAIYIPSAILEPALFYFIYDYNFFLTSFIGFIFNLLAYLFHRKFKIFYVLNCFLFLYLLLICVARIFYFNVFEFISRWNYILYLDFSLVAKGFLLIVFLLFVVYFTSLLQKRIINKIEKREYLLSIVSATLIIYLLIVIRPIYENKKYFRFQASHNGFGHEMKRDFTNYFSDFVFEPFPDGNSLSTSHFFNSTNKKEFLLILESWGKLRSDSINNMVLTNFISDVVTSMPFIAKNYIIKIDSSKFYGSSIGAEARELFNGKSDDAYLYFMHGKNVSIQKNLISNKKSYNFFTVAGYSSSGKFGVNASNVFDFRRRLGFDKIFTVENLDRTTNENTEIEGFSSVYDEVMIDSLLSYANYKDKYFGYGFTTNTHFPFIYNNSNPYIKKINSYSCFSLLSSSSISNNSKNLIIRHLSTINHLLEIMNSKELMLDKIVIVGDHQYPGYHDFSTTTVPAFIIELRK